MPNHPELVVGGIAFPEGLGWSAAEQTLLCSGVQEASVHRIFPSEGRKELVAAFGAGGANNLVLASDGGCLVPQNGGVDANLVTQLDQQFQAVLTALDGYRDPAAPGAPGPLRDPPPCSMLR